MNTVFSRFNRTTDHLKVEVIKKLGPNYTFNQALWSPMDNGWKLILDHKCGKRLVAFLRDSCTDIEFVDKEAHAACKKWAHEVANKDRRNTRMNECKGEFAQGIRLYFEDQSRKLHTFSMGPGPCGRNVVGIKMEDAGPVLRIYQFCDDEFRPDIFTYQKSSLERWTHYNAEDPFPSKG